MTLNLKIVIMGDPDVGKTSIINQFKDKLFSEKKPDNPDKGVIQTKTITVGKKEVVFSLGDLIPDSDSTASDFVNTKACIGIFDLTNSDSLQDVKGFFGMADRFASTDNLQKYICGNKSDLEAVVTDEEIEDMKEKCNIIYKPFKVSAKTGAGIEEMFAAIATDIFGDVNESQKEEKSEKGGCCVLL